MNLLRKGSLLPRNQDQIEQADSLGEWILCDIVGIEVAMYKNLRSSHGRKMSR